MLTIGRSRAFTGWLFGRMTDMTGGLSVPDADAFYRTVNRVTPGFIRTESDEVQYNLHIMMRFDLERDLVAGRLSTDDLEEAWNARFLRDFGVAVDRPSNGVLQDVHWSVGLFGYFPTYALGNVYAGCLNEAMRAAVPDLDESLARGEAGPGVVVVVGDGTGQSTRVRPVRMRNTSSRLARRVSVVTGAGRAPSSTRRCTTSCRSSARRA